METPKYYVSMDKQLGMFKWNLDSFFNQVELLQHIIDHIVETLMSNTESKFKQNYLGQWSYEQLSAQTISPFFLYGIFHFLHIFLSSCMA